MDFYTIVCSLHVIHLFYFRIFRFLFVFVFVFCLPFYVFGSCVVMMIYFLVRMIYNFTVDEI